MNKKAFSEFCKEKFGCTVTEWKAAAKWEGLTTKEIEIRLESMRLDFLSSYHCQDIE